MESVMGDIYCWFETFFGVNLAEYLWGFDGKEFSLPNLYNIIGIRAAVISFGILFFYYYILNHTRFCRWWSWLIILFVNGIVNLFIGYAWTVSNLLDGKIPDVLVHARDENGQIVATLITELNCWGFGIANFIVATLFSILITFIIKWGSRNCKHSPCF